MTEERTTNPHLTVTSTAPAVPRPIAPSNACLVVIYGDDMGRRIPLSAEPLTIGRASKCEVQIDHDSASRQHARITLANANYQIEDLGSTNGTYVNDALVDITMLRDGDQVKVGRTIFKFISSGNVEVQYHEEIYRLMTVDGLTEVHNKRYFLDQIDKETSRARRYGRGFAIVMFDIDHFKKINDTFGHLAGDAVLRQLGQLVRTKVRRDDTIARVGGEEFGVILPEIDLEGGRVLAEKLRKAVEEAVFRFETTHLPVTISAGVAAFDPASPEGTDPVKRADDKLYDAKRAGRNRVAC
jgi:diguanylate cyclase (GGDEF)-like protein